MIWVQKKKGIYLFLLITVISCISVLSVILETEAQDNRSHVEETLEHLYQEGGLYRGFTALEEAEKLKLEGEITKEEKYLFMLLLKYDFIREYRSSPGYLEQLDFYLSIIEELHNNPPEDVEDIKIKAYAILTADILDSDRERVTDYTGYHQYLSEIYGFNIEALLGYLETVYVSSGTEYDMAVKTLKTYVTSRAEVHVNPLERIPENARKGTQGSAEETEENTQVQEQTKQAQQEIKHEKENVIGGASAISEEVANMFRIPGTKLPMRNRAVRSSVKAKTGYHTESCDQPCVTEDCAGATFTKNIGQWYEVCGVCRKNGHVDNRWFNVTIALDEYYTCQHLGEVITGYYRYGNCVKYGGTSTLDTRINSFRHQAVFCPGHEKPNTYTVSYESSGGTGYMGNSNFTYDQTGKLENNSFAKDGHRFLGWSTASGDNRPIFTEGSQVKNLTHVNQGTVTMYAVWQEVINIRYNGNGATGGNEKSEEVVVKDSLNGYQVKANQAFTSYTKQGHIFAGWAKQDAVQSYDEDYTQLKNLPKNVTFDELRAIAKSQKKTDSNTTASTVNFYAVWDEIPTLKASEVLEFYEGELVTKDMLLSNITVADKEADALKKPLDIRITKLEYAPGKLVDGRHEEGELLLWPAGMPDEFVLDTWFLQLDKKDSPVTHKIIYEVTDGYGNSTALEWAVKVKYNEFPEIKSKDRYFTLAEAQNGKVTASELMTQLAATDIEDGDITSSLKIVGFAEEEFLAFQESGYVVLNAAVKDKYEKETIRQFTVNIVKDGEMKEKPEAKYLRFIDKTNYEKNIGIAPDDLTEQEIKESSANGGMKATSVWYTDEEHRNLIKATLNDKTLEETWIFSTNDISEIKKYVTSNGIENSQKEESLSQFVTKFGDLRQ